MLKEREFTKEIGYQKEEGLWKISCPFGGGLVEVEVSSQELSHDFRLASLAQGHDPLAVFSFSENVRFEFGNCNDFRLRRLEKYPWAIRTFAKWQIDKTEQPLGLVEKVYSDKSTYCYLNIDLLAKQVWNGAESTNYCVPDHTSFEDRAFAFKLFLGQVWLHERQHLIQAIASIEEKGSESTDNLLRKNAIKGLTGGLVSASGLFGMVGFITMPLWFPNPSLLSGSAILAYSLVSIGVGSKLVRKANSFLEMETYLVEKEAEISMNDFVKSLKNPFKIKFNPNSFGA